MNTSQVIFNQNGYQFVYSIGGILWQTRLFNDAKEAEIAGMAQAKKRLVESIKYQENQYVSKQCPTINSL